MANHWVITAEEREALRGLPYLARLIYYEALRPFLNYQTGIVGNPPRGISYQSIAEELYVEPIPGRHKGDVGAPTQKAIRNAIAALIDAGLLVSISAERRLVFELPLALRDESVQKSRGRGRAEEGQTSRGRAKRSSGAASQAGSGRGRAEEGQTSRGTPQNSDYIPSTSRARAHEESDHAENPLPEWLPASDWESFVEHRKAIKKPMTPDAALRMLNRLGKLRDEGHDPVKVLDLAIRNGWQDVYPKEETRSGGNDTAPGHVGSTTQHTAHGGKHEAHQRRYQSAVSRQAEAVAERERERQRKRAAESAAPPDESGQVIEGVFQRLRGQGNG